MAQMKQMVSIHHISWSSLWITPAVPFACTLIKCPQRSKDTDVFMQKGGGFCVDAVFAGVITAPFLGNLKQCKYMACLRDFSLIKSGSVGLVI